MEKAILNLKNDYGFVIEMDITDPDNPDVKVYDFDGNEVAGGGGGGPELEFDLCTITLNNTKQTAVNYSTIPGLNGRAINFGNTPVSGTVNGSTDKVFTYPFIYTGGETCIVVKFSSGQAVTIKETVNCTCEKSGNDYWISPGTPGNSSLTLTLY